MADHSETERTIKDLFLTVKNNQTTLLFNNIEYYVGIVGKPTCKDGEPKTDIFLRMIEKVNNNKYLDIKISVKQKDADFLENKMSAESAERLFGDNWTEIVKSCTNSIRGEFNKRILIHKRKYRRTDAGSITLGWKFELLNKPGGELSNEITVDIKEVYKGLLLNDDKKNARVNGKTIVGSGIADYILVVDKNSIPTKAQDILNSLIFIDQYVIGKKVYFACKALNYRTLHNPPKHDGDRPLSVCVDWNVENNKLTPKLCFDKPLITKGNQVAEKLIRCLSVLNVKNTNDLTKQNVSNCGVCYE